MKISMKEKAEEIIRGTLNRIAYGDESFTDLIADAGLFKGFQLLGLISKEQLTILNKYITEKMSEAERWER